ncbi:MAG: hypothetical protein LC799_05085 [Actinobacteria bacterium]|nr:hypothetical protein [Actinomycetota bacterium]
MALRPAALRCVAAVSSTRIVQRLRTLHHGEQSLPSRTGGADESLHRVTARGPRVARSVFRQPTAATGEGNG